MAKTLHYDFKANPSLSAVTGPTLSITRATSATMVDADGYIREVQSGEARFDGAAFNHNLSTRSEALNSWSQKLNVTITDSADSVNGVSLSEITDDATSGSHAVTQLNFLNAGARIIVSAYVKAGTSPYIGFSLNAFTFIDYFNASTGAWVSTTHFDNHAVEDLGGGYYRVSFTADESADPSAYANDLRVAMSDNGSNTSYSGSGDTIFVGGTMIERDPTGSRTSPSSYIAVSGTTPVTSLSGSNNGLLVEEARTNIALQSEDFSTTWSNIRSVENTNATTAPDGASTADELVDDSSTGTNSVAIQQLVILSTSTQYTFSVFAKASGLDWAKLDTSLFGTVTDTDQYFDLTNGAVGASPGADVDDSGIEDYGNGWYRIWIVFTTDGSDGTGNIRIFPADGDGDDQVSLDGTSSIYIWGAQLEEGSFPTSYIPTTTASVTRNADQVSTSDVSWAQASGFGSWYVHATWSRAEGSGSGADPAVMEIFASSANFVGHRSINSGSQPRLWSAGGAADNVFEAAATATYSTDEEFRWASGWAEDDVVGYLDGVAEQSDTSADPPSTAMTTFNVGENSKATGEVWNGLIKEIRYYDERLDNATLEDMSNGIFPASFAFIEDLASDLVSDLVRDMVV